MDINKDILKSIPKVDDLLASPALKQATEETGHSAVTRATREVLATLRKEILDGVRQLVPEESFLADLVKEELEKDTQPNLKKLINATGVVLHTNLGRAPLAESAVEAVAAVAASYTNLEYNLPKGERGSRYSHVRDLLCELTGAEDAMVVNNNAGAVLLLLSALTQGGQVIVSRGELVEIGGAFRVPDIMAMSGAELVEVGTTNRTRAADYAAAIDPEKTAALLKVHTSNFKIMGFTEEVELAELVKLGKKHKTPVFYDLGSGSLLPLEHLGIQGEPSVPECIKTGVDVLCFSGDKLFGGPQCGILLGKKSFIAKIKTNPFTRALRIDKMTLAALEATLRLYREEGLAQQAIPTQRMLREDRQVLRPKANRLLETLAFLGDSARVVDEDGQVGGGSVPTQLLPSAAVEIEPSGMSVTELEKALRNADTPIVARISKDRLLLDVRTIDEQDFPLIAQALQTVLPQKQAKP